MRSESNRSSLPTGHLHIPLTQNKGLLEVYKEANIQEKIGLENKYRNIASITLDINPEIKVLIKVINEFVEKI